MKNYLSNLENVLAEISIMSNEMIILKEAFLLMGTVLILAISIKILNDVYFNIQERKNIIEDQKIKRKIQEQKLNKLKERSGKENPEELFVKKEGLPMFSGMGYGWLEYAQSKEDLSEKTENIEDFNKKMKETKEKPEKKMDLKKQSLF
jgi:hypothetical protein